MSTLFGDEPLPRPAQEIAPGAHWVPGWLNAEQQRWIVTRFRQWAAGPVPLRGALVRGRPMSVQTVCLGWHWQPYEYTRSAVDVNGAAVLPMPDWMVRLGRRALAELPGYAASAQQYSPDAALVNYYDAQARLGMHQDRDEFSRDPVMSLSVGDTCRFRFGNTEHRNKPYRDIDLASGDLFVFGGASRLAHHGVPTIYPGTAPPDCGLESGRINITMRVTGLR